MWVVTVISLAAVILNIKKKIVCFYLFAVANLAWAIIDYREGLIAQSVLFVAYFVLSIYGLYEWGKHKEK
jgi:nicotinamide riboside transporter PnuC